MSIATCLFCGEVKPVGLFFRVCEECFKAEPEPVARLDRIIAERGLVAKPGSLVDRGKKGEKRHRGQS